MITWGLPVDQDRLPDHIASAESLLPDVVAEDSDARSRGVLFRREVAAARQRRAQQRKEIRRHARADDALGRAAAAELEVDVPIRSEPLERLLIALEIQQVGRRDRETGNGSPLARLEEHDKPIGIAEEKWPDQHRIDDAENGGGGSDAEPDHEHDHEGELRAARQTSEAPPPIDPELVTPEGPLHVSSASCSPAS
jgi:hypothetical protein